MVIKERVNLQRIDYLWMLLNIVSFMKMTSMEARTGLTIAFIKARPNLLVKLTHISVEYIIIIGIISIVSINTTSEKQLFVITIYVCVKALLKSELNLSDFTEACLEVHCWRSCTEK